MKKALFLLLCFGLVVVGLIWMGHRYLQPLALRSVAPDEAGLAWQECGVSSQGFDWKQAEDCFGHPMPLWSATDKTAFGESVGSEDFRLAIGQNAYQTAVSNGILPIQPCYTLYKDGIRLQTLCGEFGAHSPNISLQNVGGKVAWEFADHRLDTVIYDGQDVRRMYDLSGAYRPYDLGNKLIFVGKKDGKYFVIYDGSRVGPDFDEIMIAYCCEPVLWSVQYGQGRYLFWGSRNGQSYVVEISRR